MMKMLSREKQFRCKPAQVIHLQLLAHWWAQVRNTEESGFIRQLLTSTAKSSTLRKPTLQPMKNQAPQNPHASPILLTTSILPYHNQQYKKSGSTKFSKEFQKSGMRWLSWNRKSNSVQLPIWMPEVSPNWTSPKNWASKTHLTVEACSWITRWHEKTKT